MRNPRRHQVYISMAARAMTLALVLMLLAATESAQAQTFKVLYSFEGSIFSQGQFPYGNLLRDTAGNLYGTTYSGGPSDFGLVFEVNSSGESALFTFAGGPSDGAYPFAGVVEDNAGNFYGTTTAGGASGLGTVYTGDSSGRNSVIYSFAGGPKDGAYPYGGVMQDGHGHLYGTTAEGGSGLGTIFKVDVNGSPTLLHKFAGGPSDGQYPLYTSLIMDKAGNLYGVTEEGGTSGQGVVYELGKNGKFTVLHSFAGGKTDGCLPFGTPFMDTKGNLYGTTYSCGTSDEGIVWRISENGAETVLHNFAGGEKDGAQAFAGVVGDANGNLYGNTQTGGTSNLGTVYELNAKGKITVLHSFAGSDGEYPFGGLVRDAKGNLYGTTVDGGSSGVYGTVWQITK
jgi:uncharacterized repeat protein (TIGR03803 family)